MGGGDSCPVGGVGSRSSPDRDGGDGRPSGGPTRVPGESGARAASVPFWDASRSSTTRRRDATLARFGQRPLTAQMPTCVIFFSRWPNFTLLTAPNDPHFGLLFRWPCFTVSTAPGGPSERPAVQSVAEEDVVPNASIFFSRKNPGLCFWHG